MKNTIRCCISCILPCGVLDVIRIVHSNGRVEEISGRNIRAEDIMKAHPKHILKKPTSRSTSDAESLDSNHRGPTIVVVPPDAQLQRGKIYFLIPVHHDHHHHHHQSTKKKAAIPSSKKTSSSPSSLSSPSVAPVGSTGRRPRRKENKSHRSNSISIAAANIVLPTSTTEEDDKYLSDILSEKVILSHREKRRGRVRVWRPHLESITETLSEAASSDH